MLCEGQYGPFLSTGNEGCLLGAILREESGVGQAIDDKGAMIQFNDDPTIKMPNGTVVPMMTNDELFSVMAQPVETGSLAMMSHSIKHWHRVMGHNNWHDVAKLQQEVVGMIISGSEKKTNCNICCTEKAKRASVPKTWGTRAKNQTGYRSHRRARTHSTGVRRGLSLCSGLHRQLQPFRGSIPNEDKG